MADYSADCSRYMSEPVFSVTPDISLDEAYAVLVERGISCVAVVEDEKLIGCMSRTDLLRVGRRIAARRGRLQLLELPDVPVRRAMTEDVVTLAPDATIAEAAGEMVAAGIHRIFITDAGRPAGVISTRDVMAAIRDERDESLVGQHMSKPIFTFPATGTLVGVTELLEKAGIGGVIVTEEEWPVGMFTQVEALAARNASRNTPVEEVMNQSFVCLPVSMKMHRAAAQSLELQTRRVIATDHRDAVGVLTGLDFARSASR